MEKIENILNKFEIRYIKEGNKLILETNEVIEQNGHCCVLYEKDYYIGNNGQPIESFLKFLNIKTESYYKTKKAVDIFKKNFKGFTIQYNPFIEYHDSFNIYDSSGYHFMVMLCITDKPYTISSVVTPIINIDYLNNDIVYRWIRKLYNNRVKYYKYQCEYENELYYGFPSVEQIQFDNKISKICRR